MSENTKEAPVLKGIASENQKKARQLKSKKKKKHFGQKKRNHGI